MNDRHAIEIVILPILLLDVLLQGVDREAGPDSFDAARALLKAAVEEPVAGPASDKLLRRAFRIRDVVLARIEAADKLGLVLFWMMTEITERGVIQIGEQSPLYRGSAMVFEMLETAAEEEALMRSSEKQARKLMELLQAQGLYL